MEHFIRADIDEVEIPPISSSFYKNENYDLIRINKIILIYKFLCRHIKFNTLIYRKKHKLIKRLESSCYNETLQTARIHDIINKWNDDEFIDLYHEVCGQVLAHLNYEETIPKNANKFIFSMIHSKDYTIKFPTLKHKDLYPETYEEVEKRHAAGEQKKTKFSKLYKCRVCKESLSTITNLYNRSADEGVNIMIKCVHCGFERSG